MFCFQLLRVTFSAPNIPSLPLDLLDKMLSLDPSKRPTATDVLNHRWLQHVDMRKIPPPTLPTNQDCHEMWSKKQKMNRNRQNSVILMWEECFLTFVFSHSLHKVIAINIRPTGTIDFLRRLQDRR